VLSVSANSGANAATTWPRNVRNEAEPSSTGANGTVAACGSSYSGEPQHRERAAHLRGFLVVLLQVG
jgi:hypothetical protein